MGVKGRGEGEVHSLTYSIFFIVKQRPPNFMAFPKTHLATI